MTDKIENGLINTSYKYTGTEFSVYDTDQDGSISIFEIEQIEDEETKLELLETLETSKRKEEVTDENIQALEAQLNGVQQEQGMFSKAWDWVKCKTGLGASSDKCSNAIEDYKNGKITLEEAQNKIAEFSTKQKNSVNLVANVATGVVAVLAVGSAVLTGGMSLAVGAAIGAAVGAGTKAGIKLLDRATNQVEGDALDGKQIAKDALSGAVDGAISIATLGIGSTAVAGKTVAEQTLKNTVIQGAKYGAIDGAISGGVTGAADYTIEAAFEEDVEFNIDDFTQSTLSNAAGGALAGGVLGGASAGIRYKKAHSNGATPETKGLTEKNNSQIEAEDAANPKAKTEKTPVKKAKYKDPKVKNKINKELSDKAEELEVIYDSHIKEAKGQIEDTFSGLSSVEEISARAKGGKSIFSKLTSKLKKGKLKTTSLDDCMNAIGDAYGTRVQLKSIEVSRAKEIIEDCLDGTDVTYNQFIDFMNGKTKSIDAPTLAKIEELHETIIDLLKEEQSQEVVERMIKGIEDGNFKITELNNYGDRLTSYFTDNQLQQIADSYYLATGQKLKIVTQQDFTQGGMKVGLETVENYTANVSTDGSVKGSGYPAAQINVEHSFADGTVGKGELQTRGTRVNAVSEGEHIAYDARQGKINSGDSKYTEVCKIIKGLSPDKYAKHTQYLNLEYRHNRLFELGIPTDAPDISKLMKGSRLSPEELQLISIEGLIELSKKTH